MSFGPFGNPGYGITRTLNGVSVDDAIARVTAALADEGFGILSEINVQQTLKNKIGEDVPPYTILGACSPNLAFQAIQEEVGIGLVMPCNVVVSATDDGEVSVSIIDPVALFKTIDRPDMTAFAEEVRDQLERAINSL
jgi:uncharacterized protein (DUF302 family)